MSWWSAVACGTRCRRRCRRRTAASRRREHACVASCNTRRPKTRSITAPAPLPPLRRAAGRAAPGSRPRCQATAPRASTRQMTRFPPCGSSAALPSGGVSPSASAAVACGAGGAHPGADVQCDGGPVPISEGVGQQAWRLGRWRFAEEVDERRQQLRLEAPRRAAAAARRRRRRAPRRRPQHLPPKAIPARGASRHARQHRHITRRQVIRTNAKRGKART